MSSVAAIDLGATSGRVIVGTPEGGTIRLRQVVRFPNTPVRLADGLHWDVLSLYSAAMRGIGEASRADDGLIGAAMDSWAVDYGLLAGSRLLGNPFHYRDARNAAAVGRVHASVGPEELFRRNGLQHLPFNTVYQLAAAAAAGELDEADQLLLIPDLLGFWATGRRIAERTNASTTGLLRVDGGWDRELLPRLGLRGELLPEVVEPGTDLGPVLRDVAAEFGIADRVRFTTVGSHDTASAVVGVPLTDVGAVYISCGTWSVVGVELPAPIVTEEARLAGFSNEGGVDGRVRFLKNVMGLWILSESVRSWEKVGEQRELGALLKQAAEAPPDVPTFDANDPRLLAPGDMPARIEALLVERDARVPTSIPVLVRVVLQSLANAYADAIHEIERIAGLAVTRVHLVGGGAQNGLLCQLTADTTGVPVVAGPVEATAIGNLLIQARTHGLLTGELEELRAVTARSFPLRTYAVRPCTRG